MFFRNCHRATVTAMIIACAITAPLSAQAQPDGRSGWSERIEFGRHVRILPESARFVFYGGLRYGFHNGYWYAPRRGGYMVVRPPYGLVIGDLPGFATLLTIGAVTYWYANDVYYRAAPNGGYEVVAPPSTTPAAQSERRYIYPSKGQSAEKQASDEYDCHRWAASQSGFDPTAAATGSGAPPDSGKKLDYTHAQTACLEGRGYTVK